MIVSDVGHCLFDEKVRFFLQIISLNSKKRKTKSKSKYGFSGGTFPVRINLKEN